MTPARAPSQRKERLIGAGRVVLAASSLLAIWLDPSEPAKYARIAYGLLVTYLVYSVLVALVGSRLERPLPGWGRATHALDLVFFSLFIYFTAGPSSPFITYFVFALVCATLRWQWRGTLWTAAVALVTFIGAGYYFGEVLADPAFELRDFIIRGVYLAVVAMLLGYLGAYEAQVREEMAVLARTTAATEERIRLARDLHDGVLQSMTAVALRLEAVRRLLGGDPAAARGTVEEVQRLIELEQRDLRFFIQELEPVAGERLDAGGGPTLGRRLEDLTVRIQRAWAIEAAVEVREIDRLPAGDPFARELYHLVRESLVNAARHGRARRVSVSIGPAGATGVALAVVDDGEGFPFHGRYDGPTMAQLGLGPKSLRERVAALEGTITLDSRPSGSALDIYLPGRAA